MVKLVKLSTGEEVIAKVEITSVGVEQQTVYILQNPMRLQLNPKGVAMIPLSPFMKESAKITVDKMDVIYTVDADDDVVNAYNGQFGGILTAPPGLTLN